MLARPEVNLVYCQPLRGGDEPVFLPPLRACGKDVSDRLLADADLIGDVGEGPEAAKRLPLDLLR